MSNSLIVLLVIVVLLVLIGIYYYNRKNSNADNKTTENSNKTTESGDSGKKKEFPTELMDINYGDKIDPEVDNKSVFMNKDGNKEESPKPKVQRKVVPKNTDREEESVKAEAASDLESKEKAEEPVKEDENEIVESSIETPAEAKSSEPDEAEESVKEVEGSEVVEPSEENTSEDQTLEQTPEEKATEEESESTPEKPDSEPVEEKVSSKKSLEGIRFCIAGRFSDGVTQSSVRGLIEENGGEIKADVSKTRVDYVVVDNIDPSHKKSAKEEKAIEFGKPVISYQNLLDALDGKFELK